MKNKKGFTLIELLAVIIILGILMIIAIPSVTRYINDSRKSAYIDTLKEIIGGARNLVNEGKLEMFDTDTSYYIDQACIKTENGSRTPYGNFTRAYVIVNYDGNSYQYYGTSVDDSGVGVKEITKLENLDTELIESDLKDSDIINTLGVKGRHKYMIIDETTSCGKGVANTVTGNVSGEGGSGSSSSSGPVVYPAGKDKSTVTVGDLVTIGTEDFYVTSNDGTNLVLLTKYNLKVGSKIGYDSNHNWGKLGEYSSSDEGYGLQSSEAKGSMSDGSAYGVMSFSSDMYWDDNSCDISNTSDCLYVYSYSKLKPYVDSYKEKIEQMGVTVKEARLIRADELTNLGCDYSWTCNNAPAFVSTTSYWTGSYYFDESIWVVRSDGYYEGNDYYTSFTSGVRPVIVI